MLHEKLGDHFYRKKGVVEEVRNSFTGVIKMIETGDKIKIDQAHLETVIPAIGMATAVQIHKINNNYYSCFVPSIHVLRTAWDWYM